MKQKHFFLYITDLKSAFLFSTGFDNFFYNTVLYESDMTSYPNLYHLIYVEDLTVTEEELERFKEVYN